VSWLSFGEAETGRFVGAWRDPEGRIIVNQSDPEIDSGRPWEFVLEQNGRRTMIDRGLAEGYNARTRDWFKRAVQSDSAVWSDVYLFSEGVPGITMSAAAREVATDRVIGVFTVDFTLSAVQEFLKTLVPKPPRILVLLSTDGSILGRSSTLADGNLGSDVAATIAELPVRPDALGPDESRGFEYELNGRKMIAVLQRMDPVPGFSCVAIIAADEREVFGAVLSNARTTAILGMVALVAASIISFFLAGRMARPLAMISEDLAKVAQFNLQKTEPVHSIVREITVVGESVDRMKAGLRSFGKYVPTTLVRRLLAQGLDAELGGTERELTILFADLAGFTKLSESLSPSQTVEEMREYFQLATEAVEHNQGTLDKFLGDGILAFFNAPLDLPDHAVLGCRAALEIRDRLAAAEPAREKAGRPLLRVRIGIATGEVLVGNIGTEERFAYTVVGDTANLAARLESLNKQYGTVIIVTEEVRNSTGATYEWRRIDRVAVLGRTQGTTVFELICASGDLTEEQARLRVTYEAALERYFAGAFAKAETGFAEASRVAPEDVPSRVLRDRCRVLMKAAPENWDGIFVAEKK